MRSLTTLVVAGVALLTSPVLAAQGFTKGEFLDEARRQAEATSHKAELGPLIAARAEQLSSRLSEPMELREHRDWHLRVHVLVYLTGNLPRVWEPPGAENMLRSERDLLQLKEGIKLSREIMTSWDPAFRKQIDLLKDELQKKEKESGVKLGEFALPRPSCDPTLDAGIGGKATEGEQAYIANRLLAIAGLELLESSGDPGDERFHAFVRLLGWQF